MLVQITQQHIDNANMRSTDRCIIALAIRDLVRDDCEVNVGAKFGRLNLGDEQHIIVFSDEVFEFIWYACDPSYPAATPETFEINIPERFLKASKRVRSKMPFTIAG